MNKSTVNWEERFDRQFNKEVVVLGDYLFVDLKDFISDLLLSQKEEIRGKILRKKHEMDYGGFIEAVLVDDIEELL